MASPKSPNSHANVGQKSPEVVSDEKILISREATLDAAMGLSILELKRYKQLSDGLQANVMDLLRERNRLNNFVKDYLKEEIHKQSGVLMQFFFPSEHSLKYALQKVDEIETLINAQLEDDTPIFDENTTKKNRIEMLLEAARAYQQLLEKKITKFEHGIMKIELIHHYKQKYETLSLIIDELQLQTELTEFYIHNQYLIDISDHALNHFLNKLKSIGITGFAPKANSKDQSPHLTISFFTSIYEKLISPSSDSDSDQSISEESNEVPKKKRTRN